METGVSAWFTTMERQGVMNSRDVRVAFRIWLERLAEEKRFLKSDGSPNPGLLGRFFDVTPTAVRQWLEMRAEPTIETLVNVVCPCVGLHPDEFYAQLRTISAEEKGGDADEARKSAYELLCFYRKMDSVERNKVRMAILSELSEQLEEATLSIGTEEEGLTA